MADHNDLQSVVHPVLKRNQSSAFQLFQIILHINIALMGIRRSPSMSGEMFVHADNSLIIQPFQFCRRHPGYQIRLRTEGPVLYHFICRIGQHIRIRRRIHIKAQVFQIGANGTSGLICLLRIAASAHVAHISDLRHAKCRIASHSCHLSAFFIHGQEDGESAPGRRILLRVFKHGSGLVRIFQILGKTNQTSHRMFLQGLPGAVPGLDHRSHPGQRLRSNHKKLVYLFFQSHCLQHTVNLHVLPGLFRLRTGAGYLRSCLNPGFCKRHSQGKGCKTLCPFLPGRTGQEPEGACSQKDAQQNCRNRPQNPSAAFLSLLISSAGSVAFSRIVPSVSVVHVTFPSFLSFLFLFLSAVRLIYSGTGNACRNVFRAPFQ